MAGESYTDEVLVLQVKNWQTADKQAVCLSREHGKIVCMAYGARYAKSAVGRLLQPFACLQAEFYPGVRVDKLKTCELAGPMPAFTLPQLAYGALMAEVTEILTEQGEPAEAIYKLLQQSLAVLVRRNPRLVSLAYIIKLLDLCGIGPVYEVCVNCSCPAAGDGWFSNEQSGLICVSCVAALPKAERLPFAEETRSLWRQLRLLDLSSDERFSVKGGALMELERILHSYLLYQTDHPLKTLEFIRQLGNGDRY